MSKLQINCYSTATQECKSIFELAVSKNNSDLYFIDKGLDAFHISFHRDNSVWIRSNNKQIKPILVFHSDVSKKVNYLEPMLFYLPTSMNRYPLANANKTGYLKLNFEIADPLDIESCFFKIFKVPVDFSIDDIPEKDTNTEAIKMYGVKKDGYEENKELHTEMPVLNFGTAKIYNDVQFIKKPTELNGFKRILFLIEPHKNIELIDIFSNNGFMIDSNAIKNHIISSRYIKVNDVNIFCLLY